MIWERWRIGTKCEKKREGKGREDCYFMYNLILFGDTVYYTVYYTTAHYTTHGTYLVK